MSSFQMRVLDTELCTAAVQYARTASDPHVFILRIGADGKMSRVDVYWDNAVLQGIKASAL